MTERAASGDAPSAELREENEQLRFELARRRYDVHLAAVLVATLRSAASQLQAAFVRRPLAALARGARTTVARLAPPASRRRSALRTVARRGLAARRGTAPARPAARPDSRRYRQYYAHTRPSDTQLRSRTAALAYLERHPPISVVVCATGGDLAVTLGSLSSQVYDRVEVLVVATSAPAVPESVTVVVADGGLEAQVNAGVARATGDYVAVLLAGDLLAPHALYDLVSCVVEGYDAAYGDEDRVDSANEHVDGHLKPAVLGRETLYSYDVVGAPLLVDRALFASLGGYDDTASPVAAHDFALRLAEATERIGHVAEVLMSRPTSLDPDPMDATAATIGVVTAALSRAGATATVTPGEVLPSVRYTVAPPSPAPSVAIVIPTRDRLDLLKVCVDSVERRTTYPNYSIVICDNDSVEPETLAWMAASGHAVVPCPGPFNYAAIMNRGVAHTAADMIVTLNNDTTIATPEWLDHLVGLCSLPKVASVGVKLAYPDGRLQHEGVGIIPLPVHLSRDQNYATVDRWLASTRNAAAVTGACQIVRTEAWHELGGLDERLAVGYNDVDFNLRLCEAGWRVVYTPEVLLGHRESASRGNLHPLDDVLRLLSTWDLLGDFVDPSMPPAVRYVAGRVQVADVPPGGGTLEPLHPPHQAPAIDTEPSEEHARLTAAIAAVPATSRLARAARRLGADARAVLDGAEPSTTVARLAPPASRRRSALRTVARRGLAARRGTAPARPAARPDSRRYRQYYAHTRPSDTQLRSRTAALAYLERHPPISVVVCATGGDLAVTLGSLSSQVYDRVEVLVVATSAPAVPESVTVVVADGGLEAQVNAGVARATGDYVAVLLAGDLLAPHALYDLVSCVVEGYDAAYGDEDRVDSANEHVDGHLKPAVLGRETLYSYDVVGAPLLVDRALFASLGGYDDTASPVAAHDFALRLAEATERIGHVAEVLMSRPTSLDPDPMDATAATIGVVTAALSRAGATATVTPGEVLPSVRYTVAPPSPAPSVAIVIPTRDRLDLLKVCVDSVERRTTYPNYSIVICDNDSVEPETLAWMAASGHAVVPCPGPFNYAAIMNRGVAHTAADMIVTLNNDTTIATPEWLDHLVGLCSLPKVASVGVKLAYPDGRLQHEGVGIIPLPVHLSRDQNYATVDRWLASTRNAAAVTGACQIVRTEAWHELGGLDERLAVAFNDVDFGMRLCQAGWRVVYTPEVLLGHRESASRGDLHPPADEALLIARWDLHGRYQDPSMPPAVRLLTAKVEVDVPAPGR